MLTRYRPYLQLTPLLLVLLLFVAAPLFFVVIVSFFRTDGFDIQPAEFRHIGDVQNQTTGDGVDPLPTGENFAGDVGCLPPTR